MCRTNVCNLRNKITEPRFVVDELCPNIMNSQYCANILFQRVLHQTPNRTSKLGRTSGGEIMVHHITSSPFFLVIVTFRQYTVIHTSRVNRCLFILRLDHSMQLSVKFSRATSCHLGVTACMCLSNSHLLKQR